MRGKLVPVVVFAAMLCTPFAAGRGKPIWTVASAGELDSRIQRQLRELASHNGVPIRFSHDAGPNTKRQPDAGSLLIQLDSVGDRSAFLAELKQEARGSAVEPTAELATEGYILRSSYSGGLAPDRIRIEASSATGVHNALLRIPDLLATEASKLSTDLIPRPQSVRSQKGGTEVVIADYPSFPIRGLVEGFYGPPWSHADRLDVLRFQGQHGMNIYIYGPKDDPYHRKLWREPYPPEQMKRLGALAAAARENFVDFSFAISPGLSMIYSSEAEFQTLARKIASVSKLGVSNFALFLDDVPQDLVHPEDRARFQTLAQAHIYLINHLYEHLQSLSPHYRLTVCPTTYTNEWGNRDYIRELGAGVNREIPLDWTGPEVIPQEITVAQAQEWGGYLHRKPLVWDNFPTNDNNPWWLNLDSLRGREVGLFSAVQGLFSNPMYQAHATLIPLQSVADYLWNPVAYDPEQSRIHAIVSQYGEDALASSAPLLQIFARNREEGPLFGSIFAEQWTPVDASAVESQIARLSAAIQSLQTKPRFKKLVAEISPIPDMLRDQLARVRADAAFKHLPDGKIQWDRERDVLRASRVSARPVLDGDFAKWEAGTVYALNRRSQIEDGERLWKGPAQFSARIALAWDEENLYFGVDVTDPELYQPFRGRGVQNGDSFRLIVDTILPIAIRPGRPTGVFDLYLSPGNFTDVQPSVYCDEDFFPLRSQPHNYDQEIRTAWKKTANGFSGDIVLPARFFEHRGFVANKEIGLSFGAQKVFPPRSLFEEDLAQIVFTSKEYRFFPVESQSPATFQRLVLAENSASR